MVRDWTLVGAPSSRELGGLIGVDGRRVRAGRLIRAGALGRLTDEDVVVLGRYGLRCVIDLRHASEIEVAPPDRLPGGSRVVHLPVYDPAHPVFTYVAAVMLGHDLSAYAELRRDGTAAAMSAIYRWFVSGASARAGFAAAVRLVAAAENLPLLFHCSAGKDRTGWLSVILLTVLGVDEEQIRAEYLRTNELTESMHEVLLEAMGRRQPGLDIEQVRPVLQARTEYLDAAYAQVAELYGSFDGYLRAGLGVTDEIVETLRAQLLE